MKEYNGEKAIISMTSWKKRINHAGKSIYSILKNCPGFHFVLVLSIDEFPNKEKELPNDINTLIDYNAIELLWVKENIFAFKKVLPTMDKYREVPVISADDGCRYTSNFAEDLYKAWLKDKSAIHSKVQFCSNDITFGGGGFGIIFPPYCFGEYTLPVPQCIVNTNHDDAYYGALAKRLNIKYRYDVGGTKQAFINFFDDERNGLNFTHKSDNGSVGKIISIVNEMIKV